MRLLTIITSLFLTGLLILIDLPSFGQERSLDNYVCLTEFFDIDNWEKDKNISFDTNGLILTKGKYHPLSIVQYGILCYYKYLETSDTLYRDKFLSQVGYFKDTSMVHYLNNGRSVGLPYNFNFLDLKAPWYSGMTQGNATSFLLRYYEWSGDTTILPVIRKIVNLLTLPVEEGGTVSKTAEGYTWIEEYPNSKKSLQVLNGFINGWIGLYEYCLYFPDDTFACRIRDESYDALKNNLDKYETSGGVYYNRSKKKCTNGYIRYQIHQMDQLHMLTGEDLFKKQMMLWSFFVYNIPNNDITDKHLQKDFNFSVPLRDTAAIMLPDFHFVSASPAEILAIKLNDEKLSELEKARLSSTCEDTALVFRSRGFKNKKMMLLRAETLDSLKLDKLMIRIEPSYNKIKDDFLLIYTSERLQNKTAAMLIDYWQEGDQFCIDLGNKKTNMIEFMAISNQRVGEWKLSDLKIFIAPEEKMPFFTHYLSDIIPVSDHVSFSIDSRFTNEPVVFYRSDPEMDKVKKAPWKLVQSFSGKSGEILNLGPDDLYYQFLVVLDILGPQTSVGSISITR